MESDLANAILRSIAERKESIKEGLAVGGARTHEDYCRLVGEYAGLCDIEARTHELLRKYIEL